MLLKPVERLGGPRDGEMDVIGHDRWPAVLKDLERIVSGGGGDGSLYPAPAVCYASRPNSLVIRANGVVAKCTVALADPRNAVGRVCPDGTLDIDRSLFRHWLRGWESGDWDALSCPADGLPETRTTLLQIGPTRLVSNL